MFIGNVIDDYTKKLKTVKDTYKPWDFPAFGSSNSTQAITQTGNEGKPQSMEFPVSPQNPTVQRLSTPQPEPQMSLGQKIMTYPEQMRRDADEQATLARQGSRQLSAPMKGGYAGQVHPEATQAYQDQITNMAMGSLGEMGTVAKGAKPVIKAVVKPVIKPVVQGAFQGLKGLSTKIIEKLKGKTSVSKQFIEDLTNSGDVKQVERDLIRKHLASEGDKVDVSKFADKVNDELLPLKAQSSIDGEPRYEHIALPDDARGDVSSYHENVYESPIKTSAGSVHFGSGDEGTQNYFGHTRVEDMADGKTRRVIEVQSDLYQKGGLESEKPVETIDGIPGFPMSDREKAYRQISVPKKLKEFEKLSQYNDPTAHFRMIREEVKKAAQDGKSELLFPTGETAMKVEGLDSSDDLIGNTWIDTEKSRSIPHMDDTPYMHYSEAALDVTNLKVGKEVHAYNRGGRDASWVVTEVLGGGKFKAVPTHAMPKVEKLQNGMWRSEGFGGQMRAFKTEAEARTFGGALDNISETFDFFGRPDANNPIHKFYEKEVGKYLKGKYGATQITDENGITWWKVNPPKDAATSPVEAFMAAPLGLAMQKKDEKKKTLKK